MNLKFFVVLCAWLVLAPFIRYLLGFEPQLGFASYATGALTAVTFVLGGWAYAWAHGFLK